MKKMVSIGIAVLLVAGLATSAFAFGPDWGGRRHYDYRPGYAHQWKHSGHGYEGDKQGRHTREQHYRHQEPSYRSGAGIALPLVPLPGISFWFPGISVNIH
ncbi:hypothetical protein SAMN04489760_101105 [Syntrophus gentianae]|uniref:Uncharacterized protein n=1 Tax=Syntrophus gentianae TaxID=43775 RepID=A0A1H7UCI7_9BACT|nr:hypothetical protein [Syntrophus gentianae]SEL94671.1 hypothetical protein SAMN04489760_101105 [Syntrophus gentianae]